MTTNIYKTVKDQLSTVAYNTTKSKTTSFLNFLQETIKVDIYNTDAQCLSITQLMVMYLEHLSSDSFDLVSLLNVAHREASLVKAGKARKQVYTNLWENLSNTQDLVVKHYEMSSLLSAFVKTSDDGVADTETVLSHHLQGLIDDLDFYKGELETSQEINKELEAKLLERDRQLIKFQDEILDERIENETAVNGFLSFISLLLDRNSKPSVSKEVNNQNKELLEENARLKKELEQARGFANRLGEINEKLKLETYNSKSTTMLYQENLKDIQKNNGIVVLVGEE